MFDIFTLVKILNPYFTSTQFERHRQCRHVVKEVKLAL